MLPAGGVQHTRGRVQKHSGGRVNLWRGDVPGAAQPALCLVEFTHPDREATNPPQCGRENRPISQAVALGQGDRLTGALTRGRERDRLRRETLMCATSDLQIWSADRLR